MLICVSVPMCGIFFVSNRVLFFFLVFFFTSENTDFVLTSNTTETDATLSELTVSDTDGGGMYFLSFHSFRFVSYHVMSFRFAFHLVSFRCWQLLFFIVASVVSSTSALSEGERERRRREKREKKEKKEKRKQEKRERREHREHRSSSIASTN